VTETGMTDAGDFTICPMLCNGTDNSRQNLERHIYADLVFAINLSRCVTM